jgi:hypothetical protein
MRKGCRLFGPTLPVISITLHARAPLVHLPLHHSQNPTGFAALVAYITMVFSGSLRKGCLA